jgi:ERCC4-type nuclease
MSSYTGRHAVPPLPSVRNPRNQPLIDSLLGIIGCVPPALKDKLRASAHSVARYPARIATIDDFFEMQGVDEEVAELVADNGLLPEVESTGGAGKAAGEPAPAQAKSQKNASSSSAAAAAAAVAVSEVEFIDFTDAEVKGLLPDLDLPISTGMTNSKKKAAPPAKVESKSKSSPAMDTDAIILDDDDDDEEEEELDFSEERPASSSSSSGAKQAAAKGRTVAPTAAVNELDDDDADFFDLAGDDDDSNDVDFEPHPKPTPAVAVVPSQKATKIAAAVPQVGPSKLNQKEPVKETSKVAVSKAPAARPAAASNSSSSDVDDDDDALHDEETSYHCKECGRIYRLLATDDSSPSSVLHALPSSSSSSLAGCWHVQSDTVEEANRISFAGATTKKDDLTFVTDPPLVAGSLGGNEKVPGWEVLMLLDNREVKNRGEREFFASHLQSKGVNVEVRVLPLGDIMWVARRVPTASGGGASGALSSPFGDFDDYSGYGGAAGGASAAAAGGKKAGSGGPIIATGKGFEEYPLGYIVERKEVADLAASIIDGRYHEQKVRLKSSGMRCTYLIEGDINKSLENQYVASGGASSIGAGMSRGVNQKHIVGAMISTQIMSHFKVATSTSVDGSVAFLVSMHNAVQVAFKRGMIARRRLPLCEPPAAIRAKAKAGSLDDSLLASGDDDDDDDSDCDVGMAKLRGAASSSSSSSSSASASSSKADGPIKMSLTPAATAILSASPATAATNRLKSLLAIASGTFARPTAYPGSSSSSSSSSSSTSHYASSAMLSSQTGAQIAAIASGSTTWLIGSGVSGRPPKGVRLFEPSSLVGNEGAEGSNGGGGGRSSKKRKDRRRSSVGFVLAGGNDEDDDALLTSPAASLGKPSPGLSYSQLLDRRPCRNTICSMWSRTGMPQRPQTYQEWVTKAAKPRTFTTLALFGRMLRQVNLCSADRAELLLTLYPTPMSAYRACNALQGSSSSSSSDYAAQEHRNALIKKLSALSVPNQKISLGPAFSTNFVDVFSYVPEGSDIRAAAVPSVQDATKSAKAARTAAGGATKASSNFVASVVSSSSSSAAGLAPAGAAPAAKRFISAAALDGSAPEDHQQQYYDNYYGTAAGGTGGSGAMSIDTGAGETISGVKRKGRGGSAGAGSSAAGGGGGARKKAKPTVEGGGYDGGDVFSLPTGPAPAAAAGRGRGRGRGRGGSAAGGGGAVEGVEVQDPEAAAEAAARKKAEVAAARRARWLAMPQWQRDAITAKRGGGGGGGRGGWGRGRGGGGY